MFPSPKKHCPFPPPREQDWLVCWLRASEEISVQMMRSAKNYNSAFKSFVPVLIQE